MTSPASDDNLASVMTEVRRLEAESPPSAARVRVTFVRNFTVEPIEPFVRLQVLRAGFAPDVTFGDFDTVVQDLAAIEAAGSPPDLVVLALALEQLDPDCILPGWTADAALAKLADVWDRAERAGCTVAVHTFLPPVFPESAIAARPDGPDAEAEVARLNREVRARAARSPGTFVVLDWERYLRRVGAAAAIDLRHWYAARAPFRPAFLAAWAGDVGAVVRALKGRARKCLVLDCDNTLWGGVVGEDGLAGIRLDPFDAPGRIHRDFHAAVLRLLDRGVMVALCSKNNEADVMEVLDRHPHTLLRRSHLVAWRVNWSDKAQNLASLAAELNIGLDAMVFVDDSPAECELVRTALPAVAVVQVPERLHELPSLLARLQLFDTLTVSAEDRQRTEMMRRDRERQDVRAASTDLSAYLASLGIRAVVHRAEPSEIARVAQLTQKTNQFNVTTRRYSEADVARFAAGPDAAVWTLTAGDRFGPLGLVGVLILRRDGAAHRIDTFLMSCRALGRGLEDALLRTAVREAAAAWGEPSEWRAEFVPTAKNAQVAELWDRAGFERVEDSPAGRTYRRAGSLPWPAVPGHVAVTERGEA